MYKLTIEFKTMGELQSYLNIASDLPRIVTPPAESVITIEEPLKKAGRPKKVQQVIITHNTISGMTLSSDRTADSSDPDKETPVPVDVPIAEVITYVQVSKATLDMAKAKGKLAVLEVLKQFGVANAPGLKQEQWKDYVALIKLHMEEKAA